MYALTPRLWKGDEQLREQEPLRTALLERRLIRESRSSAQSGGAVAAWFQSLTKNLLEDNLWVQCIQDWIIYSTGLATEGLTDSEIVTEFVLAQCLVVSEGESQALESLARFQMRVLFGQMQQVKVLDCLESETEDFESDGESESKEEEYDESDEESNDNSDDESDESSDDEYKVDSMPIELQVAHLLGRDFTSRQALAWSQELQQNKAIWQRVCEEWTSLFQQVLDGQVTSMQTTIRNGTVRQMRAIKFAQHKDCHVMWKKAAKTSGLAGVIAEISKPRVIMKACPHTRELFRKNRLHDSLACILTDWTPKKVVERWPRDPPPLYETQSTREGLTKLPATMEECATGEVSKSPGRHFLNALIAHPSLIPRHSYPQAVYLLLSEDNFIHAWKTWLADCLNHCGYDIQSPAANLKAYFSIIKQYLTKRWHNKRDKFQNIVDEVLRKILERTMEVEKLRKEVGVYLRPTTAGDAGNPDDGSHVKKKRKLNASAKRKRPRPPCQFCKDATKDEDRCVRTITVSLRNAEEVAKLRGQGISCVPKDHQMKYVPLRLSKSKENKTPPPPPPPPPPPKIYHPDDLNITGYAPNQSVLEKCGKQVLRFVDEQGNLIDVVVYNAFRQAHLEKMISHSKQLPRARAIRRGNQFEYLSAGSMVGLGSREPAGGAAGDAYRAYEGMSADSLNDIDLLFNHAEDNVIILETARVYHHSLYKRFQESSRALDRLGRSACNLYHCLNYTAPQHEDDDSVPSFCTQLELSAYSPWKEFSFVQAAYGFYFETQGNMLWSFDPCRMHGTMLPSSTPLDNLISQGTQVGSNHGGVVAGNQADRAPSARTNVSRRNGGPPVVRVRVSRGDHPSVRRKDRQRAERYEQARERRGARSQYWG